MLRVRLLLALVAAALTASCGVNSADQTQPSAPVKPAAASAQVTVTSTGITTTTLTGADPIADNFDYASAFEPTTYGTNGVPGVPAITSTSDLGAFRFNCRPSAGQLLKDDPIVYPGQPGASHLHMFIGNTGANASSTYDSLRTTGGSSCDNQGQSWAINRSSYWTPAMLDGVGNAVLPDYVMVYYKRFPPRDRAASARWPSAFARIFRTVFASYLATT
jgi:hypothetical protein